MKDRDLLLLELERQVREAEWMAQEGGLIMKLRGMRKIIDDLLEGRPRDVAMPEDPEARQAALAAVKRRLEVVYRCPLVPNFDWFAAVMTPELVEHHLDRSDAEPHPILDMQLRPGARHLYTEQACYRTVYDWYSADVLFLLDLLGERPGYAA